MQLGERTIEVVLVAEVLGNRGIVGPCESPCLRREPSQNVIGVAGCSGLISQRGEMADCICAGVISVADNGRAQGTTLRAVALGGDAMQFVIAVTDGLRGRSG